jgi:flagellar motor protein MotB
MTLNHKGSRGTQVSPRVALISIFAFWLVYFAVATIRSLIVGYGHQVDMLAARGFVAIGSMVATYIVYLAMRPLASRSLTVNITAIALLAIPAAIAYSSMNITAFKQIDHRIEQEKTAAKASKVVIRSPEDAERLKEQAEALRDAAQQIKDQAREAVQQSRESAREAALAARESVRDAREAVQRAAKEAQRHGIKLDTDAMLAEMVTPPPEPPEPPASVQIPAPAMMIQVGQPSMPDHEMDLSIAAQIADQAMNGYFFFVAWGALFLALSYAAAVRVAEREAASYRAAARDAELRALRYQVNPHFLFNTLNSLSSLVMTGKREEAERMILNLSNFFRTSLSGDPTEDVPLSAEIQLQRLYLDIEGVRFPDRLLVKVDLPETLRNACVPGLLLQPLVENAVKYGVAPSRQPVTIRLSALEDSGGLVLTVENGGEAGGLRTEEHGTGVGLANVRDRLAARFGDRASCRWGPLPGGGFRVTLTMPMIHAC